MKEGRTVPIRSIIIGDIHGCNRELCDLLEKVQPGEEDRVILLGDLFDRGPESWEVFRTVKGLAEELGDRFVLLRGNHEDYLLAEKLTFGEKQVWNRVGRRATVRSFRAHRARMEDAIPWLAEHSVLWWKGPSLQAVHAGVKKTPVEENDNQTLMHDHDIVLKNTYAGPLTVTGHIALEYPMYFPGDGRKRQPVQPGEWHTTPEHGVICIDTGCGKGGRLTAMIAEEGRFRLESVSENEHRSGKR